MPHRLKQYLPKINLNIAVVPSVRQHDILPNRHISHCSATVYYGKAFRCQSCFVFKVLPLLYCLFWIEFFAFTQDWDKSDFVNCKKEMLIFMQETLNGLSLCAIQAGRGERSFPCSVLGGHQVKQKYGYNTLTW